MGMYQTFDVILGIATSEQELSSLPAQDWSGDGEFSPHVLVQEYEPGENPLPSWFSYGLYDDLWTRVVIGAGKSASGLFHTVNRMAMPGIEKVVFPPAEEIIQFLEKIGFVSPQLELYAVSKW